MTMRASLAAAALIAVGFGATGCVISDDDDDGFACLDCAPGAVHESIDTDVFLETDLGEGAGLFVEYEQGGLWRLWTSCDAALTDHTCQWDVFALSSSFIDDVVLVDGEGVDHVDVLSGDEIDFFAETGFDSDSVEFFTDPGSPLQVDPFLDGFSAPDFVVWSSGGVVVEGAPRAPIIFTPDLP